MRTAPTGFTDGTRAVVVDVSGGAQPDAEVPVFVCVLAEEAVAEHAGVLDATEGLRLMMSQIT